MSKRLWVPGTTVGYGYVGVWLGGQIGWFLPRHLSPLSRRDCPESPSELLARMGKELHSTESERAFLCEITIRPVRDSLGRPQTRIMRQERADG